MPTHTQALPDVDSASDNITRWPFLENPQETSPFQPRLNCVERDARFHIRYAEDRDPILNTLLV
ncbi:MAG: hypothetical protein CME19_09845 [Gemmatimonadetes bacterium]|nr:hypothetical protein [Gemmatimonadota bacterium]